MPESEENSDAFSRFKNEGADVITFTSSSTARNFADLLGNDEARSLKDVQVASIGPVTSATLRELQLPPAIEAREFTMGGLIRAIVLARYAEHAG